MGQNNVQYPSWTGGTSNTDPIQALMGLLQPNADPNQAQNGLGPATLTKLGQAGATTAQATGPYQEGVAKALKALGQQHATEAVQAGMSPQDVQSHELMQQPTQINPDTMAILSQLIKGVNTQQSQDQQDQNKPQSQNALNPIQQQAINTVTPQQGFHPLGMLLNTIGNMTGILPAQEAMNNARLTNLSKAQEIAGQEPLQKSEYQKNQLPMTEYERAQTNVQKASMLLNYGGKVSDNFQNNVNPHVEAINDALSANNLYNNVLNNPNDQQAAQAFLEASAKLQGVKDPKELMSGRGAQAGIGAVKQFFGKSGFSEQEMARIQKANIAQYKAHQKALESLTQQHQDRLKKVGLDPDQFINKYSIGSNNNPNVDPAAIAEAKRRGLI